MHGRWLLAIVPCLIICETTFPGSGIHLGLSNCVGDDSGMFRTDAAVLQTASSMLAAVAVDTGTVRTCRKASGRPIPAGFADFGRFHRNSFLRDRDQAGSL